MKPHSMRAILVPLAMLATVLLPAVAAAEVIHADLDGYSEIPAVSTTGAGQFQATIRQNDQAIDYVLTYEDLEGTTTTAAHIHLGQEAVVGGVSAFLCGGGGTPPCPNPSGTVTGTITAANVIGPVAQGIAAGELAELVRAIRAGMTYVNVHTNKHPSGEIRGQVRGHGVGRQ